MDKIDWFYNLKKSWFGFWQRYHLKTQVKITSRLLLIFLIIWLIASILTILCQWGYSDHFEGSPFQAQYLKYFWAVIIELVSGFDAPAEKLDLNPISDILTVMVLITGIFIFAIFTGQIVSMFIHVMKKLNHLPEKPPHFQFRRPIIICGINQKLHRVIQSLRRDHLAKGREIVVIGENSDQVIKAHKELYKDTWYVKGDQADRDILKNAMGSQKNAAIILTEAEACENVKGRYSDSRALETALAIEGYRQNTHTVMELQDDRNIPHLEHTQINEWISIQEYGIKLTAQAVLQQGMGKVFYHLLGANPESKDNNRIYFSQSPLPPSMAGYTYEQVRDKIMKEPRLDITLMGFSKYIPGDLGFPQGVSRGNTPYILQLNPVSYKCRSCGRLIKEKDEWGRVKSLCPHCIEGEVGRRKGSSSQWFFPLDTIITPKDKLVYLAREPVDFDSFYKKCFFRRQTNEGKQ